MVKHRALAGTRMVLSTLILWPFVIWMYYKLARKEEQETLKKYPEQYRKYMQQTPVFFPKLSELAAVNKRKP
jgi:protein-S-isoprenylcysteine O-methyltransferase Ste14